MMHSIWFPSAVGARAGCSQTDRQVLKTDGACYSRSALKALFLIEVSRGVCVQDADSEDKQGKKSEGAFYVWTAEEVQEVLGQRAELFMAHYYVKPNGNVDLTPRQARANHLKITQRHA